MADKDKKKDKDKDRKRKDRHGKKRDRAPEPSAGPPEALAATAAKALAATAPKPPPSDLDQVRYAEFKVLLRPDRLRRIAQAYELWKHLRTAVEEAEVGYVPIVGEPSVRQRDIIFYDTPDFRLYENHFILRRRTHFRDGWTTSHDELTFKFRHPEVEKARAIDMHLGLVRNARIKFKREILPLQEHVGGVRHIYTRNCVLTMPALIESFDLDEAAEFFPALRGISTGDHAKFGLVNRVTVSETLTEFGSFDFGKGLQGVVSLALWRDTRSSAAIVSELGFQLKFDQLDEETERRLARVEDFFKLLQHTIAPWIYLGTTKTNLVYRRGKHHEVQNSE
jgi:hypothetical protein